MLDITIKDLELRLSNLNPPLSKSVIWFELVTSKRGISKQTTSVLYCQLQEFLSQERMLIWKKHKLKPHFCVKIKLLQSV